MKVTVNYYRIGFDDYEDMDDLLDSDFIKKNSEPYKSYSLEICYNNLTKEVSLYG